RPDVCGDISHSYKTLDPYNGARKSGLTLKLGVKQSSVPKDSPIVLEIAITNETDEALQLDLSRPEDSFDLEIRGPSGTRPIGRDMNMWLSKLGRVEAGETLTRTYTVLKELVNSPGEYKFAVTGYFFRLDGGGIISVQSDPVKALVGGRSTEGQESKPVEEDPRSAISIPPLQLVKATDALQKMGLSVSTTTTLTTGAKNVVISRDKVTIATVEPLSDELTLRKWPVKMGHRAELQEGELLLPGNIISVIRVFGG
ncbi:MAG: hypothetical protein Q7T82_16285, partial [Armatimonadota bacterium]|nr:hypothetical protein [Armatimonadota bacterium]